MNINVDARGYAVGFVAFAFAAPPFAALLGVALWCECLWYPLLAAVAMAILWTYICRRVGRSCSAPGLSYRSSLAAAAAEGMTGCANISIFLVFPILVYVGLASLVFTAEECLRRSPGLARKRWLSFMSDWR